MFFFFLINVNILMIVKIQKSLQRDNFQTHCSIVFSKSLNWIKYEMDLITNSEFTSKGFYINMILLKFIFR